MEFLDYIYSTAFYLTAAVAVASALIVIWHKNPVISALYLVLTFFAVAVLYVLLRAHFLAAIQVLLYAGAILVLFLMMVMLLNLSERELGGAKPTLGKAAGLAAVMGVILVTVVMAAGMRGAPRTKHDANNVACLLAVKLHEDPEALKPAPIHRCPDTITITAETDYVKMTIQVMEAYADPDVRLFSGPLEGTMARMSDTDVEEIRQRVVAEYMRKIRPHPKTGIPLDPTFEIAEKTFDPREFIDLERDDVYSFIRVAARARLRHLNEFGGTASIGRVLFSRYYLPFEAASILLFAAIIGVMVLARRSGAGEEGSQ